jgi:hypothetical protein
MIACDPKSASAREHSTNRTGKEYLNRAVEPPSCRFSECGRRLTTDMNNVLKELAQSKAIITDACLLLKDAQHRTVAFGREACVSNEDCYILLNDATKLYCRALSQIYGEADGEKRWSPALPELLLSHPEKCDETLALLEAREFKEPSDFHFVNA